MLRQIFFFKVSRVSKQCTAAQEYSKFQIIRQTFVELDTGKLAVLKVTSRNP